MTTLSETGMKCKDCGKRNLEETIQCGEDHCGEDYCVDCYEMNSEDWQFPDEPNPNHNEDICHHCTKATKPEGTWVVYNDGEEPVWVEGSQKEIIDAILKAEMERLGGA
jgi:hypothetical protein